MLINSTPEQVSEFLNNDGPTKWYELYSVLHAYGVLCAPRLKLCFDLEDLPEVAVMSVPSGSPATKHWVVRYGANVYDPACGVRSVYDLMFPHSPSNRVNKYATVTNVAVIGE